MTGPNSASSVCVSAKFPPQTALDGPGPSQGYGECDEPKLAVN